MNKFALVTGSSSGLGLAISNYLLDDGFIVIGASRSGTDIVHGRFIDVLCDLRKEKDVENLFEIVSSNTDGLSLVVSNAGVCSIDPIEETSSKDFSSQIETNILGTFHLFKHLSSHLIDDESHIVSISSIAAFHGYPNTSGYCASKFGLRGLIESCRNEWKEMGVRFSTLSPGAIDTPLWDKLEVNWERDKMLSVDDFLHVFEMVVSSPRTIQFPELIFLHKDGVFVK